MDIASVIILTKGIAPVIIFILAMALNSVGKNSRNVLLLNTSSIVQSNQSFKNSTTMSFVTHDLPDQQCGITVELAVDKFVWR